MTLTTVTHLRRTFLLAFSATILGVAACEDPFAPKADLSNIDTTVEVWALTGTPANFPTVFLVPQRLTVRPDAAASFDLGFDIDTLGRLLVLPVGDVVTSTTQHRRVGLIRTTEPYANIVEAPRTGWVFDSTVAVAVGEIFIVRVQTQFCANQFQSEVYAKFMVDSVFPVERRIKLSGRVNPNCGFRSFLSGIPKF